MRGLALAQSPAQALPLSRLCSPRKGSDKTSEPLSSSCRLCRAAVHDEGQGLSPDIAKSSCYRTRPLPLPPPSPGIPLPSLRVNVLGILMMKQFPEYALLPSLQSDSLSPFICTAVFREVDYVITIFPCGNPGSARSSDRSWSHSQEMSEGGSEP